MRDLLAVLGFCSYLAGIAIAKGFWMTAAALLIPPYSFYLVVERYLP